MSLEVSNIFVQGKRLNPNDDGKNGPIKESKPQAPIFKSSFSHYSFQYKNSKGETVVINDHITCRDYIAPMTILNKYFENGRIPISKKDEIMQDISANYPAVNGGKCSRLDINRTLRDAVADFTDEQSPGGTDITVEEVYRLYERFGAYFKRLDN